MTHDERISAWKRALADREELANEKFQSGGKPTIEDIVVVALSHPEAYDILVQLKES